jgi:hypothetical protein
MEGQEVIRASSIMPRRGKRRQIGLLSAVCDGQ